MHARSLRWLVWVTVVVVWTVALLVPLPDTSGTVLRHNDVKFWVGKSLHVGMYALLAALAGRLPLARRGRLLVLAFLAAHAVATESLQPLVGRTGAAADVGLDLLGIILGVVLTWRRDGGEDKRPA